MMKFRTFFRKALDKSKVERMFKIRIEENNMRCSRDLHNLVVPEMSKHFNIKYQFLVDHALKGNNNVFFVSTDRIMD